MRKKILFGIAITLAIQVSIVAHVQEVKIGYSVPDMKITNVINYPLTQLRFSDFKGKLIVLDFWSTKCTACIRAFSHFDSLQKEYSDKLQMILVNAESKEIIEPFLKKRKNLVVPKVPMITSDTLLSKMFPHETLPYHVWIDSAGFFRFESDGTGTTRNSIARFLESDRADISKQRSKYKSVSSYFDPAIEESLMFYSYLSHLIPEIRINPTGNEKGIHLTENGSIISLLITAFNEGGKYNFGNLSNKNKFGRRSTIELEIKDSSRYFYLQKDEPYTSWKEKSLFTYDLFLPKSLDAEKFRIMQGDLCRNFGLQATIQKRKVSCFVLIRTSKEDKLKSIGGPPIRNFYHTNYKSSRFDSLRTLRNSPFEMFSDKLGYYLEERYGKPFKDETGYSGKIDIEFRGGVMDSLNLTELQNELKKYDLQLIEAERDTDVLVIKEIK